MGVNKQILLAARPVGFPKETDFQLVESAMPALAENQFLVQAIYLSVDPYMRGRMNDAKSYAPPVAIGGLMGGGVVGRIIESKNDDYALGQIIQGQFGWQEYAVSDGQGVRKVDPELAPISTALGILGMPGLTAYFGLLEIGKPMPGETVRRHLERDIRQRFYLALPAAVGVAQVLNRHHRTIIV